MNKTCLAAWGALITAGCLALSGCGKAPETKPATGHALPTPPYISKYAPGQFGGQLILAITNPPTFNPVLANSPAAEAVTRLLFSSLVVMDLAGDEAQPGLAESWSVDSDQRTWTFKLRKGLRWSDGEPLIADDVVFTWNSVLNDRTLNPFSYNLYRLNGTNLTVTKVDDVTVRMVTPVVFAPFLEFFGPVAILPEHIFARAIAAKRYGEIYRLDAQPSAVVGCGPFRIKEIIPWKSIVLERNPEFWMVDSQGRRLPYLDEVKFVVADDTAALPELFFRGKYDAYETMRTGDFDRFKQASNNGHFQLVPMEAGADSDCFWFNQNTGTDVRGRPLVNPVKLAWFRNSKFREAVSCAIDRDRIVREAYGGRARPVYGLVPEQDRKWFNPGAPVYRYDPPRARALLAEAGIRDRAGNGVATDAAGNPVEISLLSNTGNPAREKSTELVAEDLQKVGIRLNPQLVDFRLLVSKVNNTFDYECAWMGLGGGVSDPTAQIEVLKSSEALHQWFPYQTTPSSDWEARIDALMNAQAQTLDYAQRKKYFDEVQVIWANEAPMIGTVAPFAFAAIRPDIANLRPSAISQYRLTWNIQELYFTKK